MTMLRSGINSVGKNTLVVQKYLGRGEEYLLEKKGKLHDEEGP